MSACSARTTGRSPAWAADERLARAALSGVVEPDDQVATALVATHGGVRALQVLLEGPRAVADLDLAPAPAARLARALGPWRQRLQALDPGRAVEAVAGVGGRVVVPGDAEWPSGLDALGWRAPVCLWVRGAPLVGLVGWSLAVVGARAATPYGEQVAGELSAGVAAAGVGVVSGGAYGIDAAAHRGALAAGAPTVAVLACGVDRVYPRGHERLLAAVLERGALVSEAAPGAAPLKQRFLARNRLIAAMTSGCLVVEAAWRSGALSTAAHAAGLSRPLGAVPGPVTSPASAGCHRLLREGAATCVTGVDDALELVTPLGAGPASAPGDDVDAGDGQLLAGLSVRTARGAAELARRLERPLDAVEAALGRLALRDLVEADGGGWRRARVRRGA